MGHAINTDDLDDEPDPGPRRLWVLTDGNYLYPGWPNKPRPWIFRGGDEYGNRTLCLRLPPIKAVLVIATTIPLKRTLLDPEEAPHE